uniref:Helicase-associated domain-containing protein n=1 Tax=Odontella aurita TaxID=265563 RepID=A0A7S4JIK2_9STRA
MAELEKKSTYGAIHSVPAAFGDSDDEEEDEEDYIQVYAGSDGDEHSDEIDENEEELDVGGDELSIVGEGDNVPEKCIYAVRRGRTVKNCIFLYWEDCLAEIDGCDGFEYETFTLFNDAVQFISSDGEEGRRRGRPRGRLKMKKAEGEDVISQKGEKAKDWEWERNFKALERFHSANGHCFVPNTYTDGTLLVGNWVKHQRRAYSDLKRRKTKKVLVNPRTDR